MSVGAMVIDERVTIPVRRLYLKKGEIHVECVVDGEALSALPEDHYQCVLYGPDGAVVARWRVLLGWKKVHASTSLTVDFPITLLSGSGEPHACDSAVSW